MHDEEICMVNCVGYIGSLQALIEILYKTGQREAGNGMQNIGPIYNTDLKRRP